MGLEQNLQTEPDGAGLVTHHKSLVPWYLIVLSVAVTAATKAAHRRPAAATVSLLDRTAPISFAAPACLKTR